MKPKPPCLNCDERILGCHSECDLYHTFRRSLEEYNRLARQQNYDDAQTFLIEQTLKRKR